MLVRIAACCTLLAAGVAPALGWGAHGHRLIAFLALDGLPASAPEWLREPQTRKRIADQSNEADRWRGWNVAALGHVNKPDHYLDIELLDQFGLTLETVPPLRNEYLRALIIAKHTHPERVDPYDAADDPDRSKEWPGFILHAIAEHYAKLQSSFNQVRILEQIDDPQRAFQLHQARENAIYHMGMLSHFVGDMCQPLHTTKHFNGWVGENPEGYTTSRRFHPYIDSGVLEHHAITYEDVRPAVRYGIEINAMNPWDDVIAYLRRSFAEVEPLYRMEHDDTLNGPEGKALIIERLADGAAMLSALYWSAYVSSAPNPKQVADWIRYNEMRPGSLPPPPVAPPATQPAETPAAP